MSITHGIPRLDGRYGAHTNKKRRQTTPDGLQTGTLGILTQSSPRSHATLDPRLQRPIFCTHCMTMRTIAGLSDFAAHFSPFSTGYTLRCIRCLYCRKHAFRPSAERRSRWSGSHVPCRPSFDGGIVACSFSSHRAALRPDTPKRMILRLTKRRRARHPVRDDPAAPANPRRGRHRPCFSLRSCSDCAAVCFTSAVAKIICSGRLPRSYLLRSGCTDFGAAAFASSA